MLYFQGLCRYLEGQVLYLQKQIEGQSDWAQDTGIKLLKVRPPSGLQDKMLLKQVPLPYVTFIL